MDAFVIQRENTHPQNKWMGILKFSSLKNLTIFRKQQKIIALISHPAHSKLRYQTAQSY